MNGELDNLDRIKVIVAAHFELRTDHLDSPRRAIEVARPRQIAMSLVRELVPGKTTIEIGRRFGNRDHKTVLHAVERCNVLRGRDKGLEATYVALRARCIDEIKPEDAAAILGGLAAAEVLVERIVSQIRVGLLHVALERPAEFVACVLAREPFARHPAPAERATPARDVPVGQLWAFPPEGMPQLTVAETRRALEARHATKAVGKERVWPVKPDFRAGAAVPAKAGAR